jgi:probable rRNA maturation factor
VREVPGRDASSPIEGVSAPTTSPASEPIEVEISDTQGHLVIDPQSLMTLVRKVLAGEGFDRASISIALVDDRSIHAVNRRHLGHDSPTDVISFRFSDPGEPVLTGELVVSTEHALTVARRVGTDPWAELALYVVHGLLHLCGYDDLAASDVVAMRRREGEILSREGLLNTFPLVDLAEAVDGERESERWSD